MTKKTSKKEQFTTPKGTHDIIGKDYYRYQGFFEKAQEIAVYYGFQPIETPILEKNGVFSRTIGEETDIVEKEMYTLKTKGGDKLVMRPEGTAAIMRAYIEHGMHARPQPVMLYYYGPFFRHENPQKGRFRQFWQFGLEILGTSKSVADAIIIQTALRIVEESGLKNPQLLINSLGDKESRQVYIKELSAYYRRHTDKLCHNCKHRLRINPLRVLDCKEEKCQPIKKDVPESINYLTPESKKQFKEVLEYLDSLSVSYIVDNTLVRGLDYYSHTIFEITHDVENLVAETDVGGAKQTLSLGGGGRYDYLAKNLGSKKDIPGVGASLGVDRILMDENRATPDPKIVKKPKVYFVQLGFEAKLKSLSIIEILRKAKIPMAQSLSKDSLTGQLASAEKRSIPFVIIFGQKEAVDGTVIIRKMENRSQETIRIEHLAEYIKKIK